MVPQSTAQAKYQKFAHEQFRGLYLEGDRRPYHSQFSHCSGPVLIKSNNGAGRALERCPGRVAGLCWEGHSQDRRRAQARRTSVRVHPSLYLSTRFMASLSYAHTHTSPSLKLPQTLVDTSSVTAASSGVPATYSRISTAGRWTAYPTLVSSARGPTITGGTHLSLA